MKPNAASYTYEQLLMDRGLLRVAPLGDNFVACIGEPEARAVYLELLRNDPNYFIERPFQCGGSGSDLRGPEHGGTLRRT